MIQLSRMALIVATIAGLVAAHGFAHAQETKAPTKKEVQVVLDKAIKYLRSSQEEQGGFSSRRFGPGVTALVVAGLLQNGVSEDDPMVTKALKYMESNVQENGGIYSKFLANYTTSVAVMAFKEADTKGKYDALLKNAAKFLKKLLHDQPESLSKDVEFGGFGYDKGSRPDMSNTAFTVEALLAAGVSKDDPAIKKALVFLSRSQNLPSEKNDQVFAKKATKDDKGGFVYTPVNPKKSGDRTAVGGLRSVGAMTYNGLKSFLYAGVSKKDKRVKAAMRWIKRHYTLKENPGVGKAGLFYYYHTFAKTMTALGNEVFVDADKKKHYWKRELFEAIKSQQLPNGSWVNRGDRRFGEAMPDLATAFAILSLSYTGK
ncbi:MAG: prenyltransferase/squalene oxidase repeat-containing protein [Gemmataceae bacterium]